MRNLFKKLAFILAFIFVLPAIFLAWLEELCGKSEGVFSLFSHFFSLFPGPPGSYFRSAYYYGTLEKCAWNFHISFGSFFAHRTAEIGKNVSIGAYCVIGTAAIGEGTMIASRCSIPSGKAQHLNKFGILSKTFSPSKVYIGKNVWVGEGAIIMADVGDGSIVSAGSVLTQKAPSQCVMSGVPAHVKKHIGVSAPSII